MQYLISSRGITEEYDARYFLGVKRRHWGIEVFHYVKDVVLREDENKTEVAMIDGLINSIIYNMLKEDWTKKMRKYNNKPLKLVKEHDLITINT